MARLTGPKAGPRTITLCATTSLALVRREAQAAIAAVDQAELDIWRLNAEFELSRDKLQAGMKECPNYNL